LDWVQRIKDVVGINKMEVLVVWKPTLDGCWTGKLQITRVLRRTYLEFCRIYNIDKIVAKEGLTLYVSKEVRR
jgi:hypothetical protein